MLLFFLKCSAESFVDALFEDKIPITESLKNIEQAPFSKILLGYSRTGLFFQAQLEKKFYFVLLETGALYDSVLMPFVGFSLYKPFIAGIDCSYFKKKFFFMAKIGYLFPLFENYGFIINLRYHKKKMVLSLGISL
jgi:hypothetical protein